MASKALRTTETQRSASGAERRLHGITGKLAAAHARIADVRELRSGAFIESWDALARAAAEPNPFFESWYLLPSLATIDPQGKVSIIVVEQAGTLIGLMPLRQARRYYRHPFPHLRNWVHPNMFLGAPLVREGHESAFWGAFLAQADSEPGTALFAHLVELAGEGPLFDALAAVCATQDRPAGIVHSYHRALLQSGLGAEAYYEQSLRKKRRKELERLARRLGELGNLKLETAQDDREIEGWIEEFLALESAGWKGEAGSALRSASATAKLAREAMAGAARRKLLHRVTLRLDGRMIGALTSFMTAPGGFGYKTAYDETYARFSPGLILQRAFLAILGNDEIQWCDSCAAPDHPMIDHFWRERRPILRVNVGIGGALRRSAAKLLLRAESAQPLSQAGGTRA